MFEQIKGEFNSNSIKVLGSITPNTLCTLYAFGSSPIQTTVMILEPKNCDLSTDDTFCSEHTENLEPACWTFGGAPLFCGEGETVSGFVSFLGQCRMVSEEKYLQSYHSIENFKDWIEEVSGATIIKKASAVLITAIFFIHSFLL